MMSLTTKLLIFVLAAASCSTASAPAETVEPSMRAGTAPEPSPETLPDVCSFEADYCEPCGGTGEPLCPQGKSGALCCLRDACVVWSGSHCSGDLGWCFNYTTEQDPTTGINEATCHDGEGDE